MDNLAKIYLDYAATTPVDPRVLTAMLPYFSQVFGNPSSVHTFGQQAEAALEDGRESVARTLHCQPGEIIFTSCGSESDNLALRGIAMAAREQRNANHILITPVEHPAVSKTAEQLRNFYGFELEYLPVDGDGQVDPADVAARLRGDTALVSIIYANNEIGTLNPIREVGEVCRAAGVPLHSDAVQAAAYCPVDVDELQVDLLSIGAHKFYGPKGVGALYIRQGHKLLPTQTGGSQEQGIRAGTSNIPYIVGLAKSLQLAHDERQQRSAHVLPLAGSPARGRAGINPRGARQRLAKQAVAQPCQFYLQRSGWQHPPAPAGCGGICLFLRLGMQDRKSGTLGGALRNWTGAGLGAGVFESNPGRIDDRRGDRSFSYRPARECRKSTGDESRLIELRRTDEPSSGCDERRSG